VRIFLVGSGPSLAETPMDALQDEDVMVMNKFGRIDSHHGWGLKPKYYFKIDHNTVDMSHREEIMWGYKNCEHLFLWERFKNGYLKKHPNYDSMPYGVGNLDRTTWITHCEHKPYHYGNSKAAKEWHLPELCTGYGGMSVMIQLAVKMSYDEVYLLGCDLGYTSDVNKNHAIPAYTSDRRDKSEMDNGNMLALHKMAYRCSPVPIYNATVGGELEIYPRKDIWEII
jgi:hypothetical protein